MTEINFKNLFYFLLFTLSICSCDKEESPESNSIKNSAIFNSNLTYGTMVDQEGNSYKTIIIGNQTWMAENLRTTKFRDGSNIPNVSDKTRWHSLNTGAYCNFNNTLNSDSIIMFGRLYNWYVVSDRRILAPEGWHIPSVSEWGVLTNYLGGLTVAGGKLKEVGITHWLSPNKGGTNESGFTALPAGYRGIINGKDSFVYLNFGSIWWSSTTYDNTYAWSRGISSESSSVFVDYEDSDKVYGMSIRCIKD